MSELQPIRKHYMTLCYRDNTEVTHIKTNKGIEVTFEQSCAGGFKTLVTSLDGCVLSNTGFNQAEVQFFCDFVKRNKEGIIAESMGVI